MSSLERLLEEEGHAAEQGLDTPLQPGTRATRGHGRTKTLQVRLNDSEYDALVALAESRQLPVSTLVRSLLVPLLRMNDDTPAALIERMRQQLDQLSRQLG